MSHAFESDKTLANLGQRKITPHIQRVYKSSSSHFVIGLLIVDKTNRLQGILAKKLFTVLTFIIS